MIDENHSINDSNPSLCIHTSKLLERIAPESEIYLIYVSDKQGIPLDIMIDAIFKSVEEWKVDMIICCHAPTLSIEIGSSMQRDLKEALESIRNNNVKVIRKI